MKKIMFDDRFDLTKGVLHHTKTMTRRIVEFANGFDYKSVQQLDMVLDDKTGHVVIKDGAAVVARSLYNVGEVVAIAQAYKDVFKDAYHIGLYGRTAGWTNKMFVKASHMPHHIKITGVKIEHLQNITEEDCLKEGVRIWDHDYNPFPPAYDFVHSPKSCYETAREAFASLIDLVSGKGTWDSNPLVWVYSFELIS